MIRFGVKLGIAAGTYYYLSEEGVWRESEHSVKAYNKLTATVSPYVKEVTSQIPIEFPELPSSERISFVAKHYWNQGVLATFDFAQNLPEHVAQLGCKTMQMINANPELKKFIDSMTTAPAQTVEDAKDTVKKDIK